MFPEKSELLLLLLLHCCWFDSISLTSHCALSHRPFNCVQENIHPLCILVKGQGKCPACLKNSPSFLYFFGVLNCSQNINALKPCRRKVLAVLLYAHAKYIQHADIHSQIGEKTQKRHFPTAWEESCHCQRPVIKTLEPVSSLSGADSGGGAAEGWVQNTPLCVLLSCHQHCQQIDKPNSHLSCVS